MPSFPLLPFAIPPYGPKDSEEFLHMPSSTWPSAAPASGWRTQSEMPSAPWWMRAPATAKIWEWHEWDKRNVLSCAGKDTGSYYHVKTKKEYFPNFFSVCPISVPDSQDIFLLFCTTCEVDVSSRAMPHGWLWPCSPLHFFAFPGLSLAFTQEISLEHQEPS